MGKTALGVDITNLTNAEVLLKIANKLDRIDAQLRDIYQRIHRLEAVNKDSLSNYSASSQNARATA